MPITRKALWWRLAIRQGTLFQGLLILFCGGLAVATGFIVKDLSTRFDQNATTTTATVTAKSQVTKVGAGGGTSYQVKYRYEVAGIQHTGEGFLSFATWDSLKTGDSIEIRYRNEKPAESETLVGRENAVSGGIASYVLWGLGGLFLLLGLWLFLSSRRQLSQQLQLIETGDVRSATITTPPSEHGVIGFRYEASDGSEHDGQVQAPHGIGNAQRVGQTFIVIIDPANPTRHEVDLWDYRDPFV